jgi:hypothetical protein
VERRVPYSLQVGTRTLIEILDDYDAAVEIERKRIAAVLLEELAPGPERDELMTLLFAPPPQESGAGTSEGSV